MELTSAQNPRIKHLLALQQKSSERRREGLFVVEGRRELEHCLAAGYELDCLFVSEELRVKSEEFGLVEKTVASSSLFTLSSSLYEKVAYRGSTEGIIAIVKERRLALNDLQMGDSPLIVVLERVEKPGNLGAVLRSADAAKADAVIVCDPLTDLFNPNLIRSSIGALFTVSTGSRCPPWPAPVRSASLSCSSGASASSPRSCKTHASITIPTCAVPRPLSWARSRRGSLSSGARRPRPTSASPCLAVSTRSTSPSRLPSSSLRPYGNAINPLLI